MHDRHRYRWGLLAVIVASFAIEGHPQSIFTVAGGGTDDGRPAILAAINQPHGVAVDLNGNLFIADTGNHRIRRVAIENAIISTIAGNGSEGYGGDGGKATEAGLAIPRSVVVDKAGNVFFADTENHRIRKVTADGGIISTVAGIGVEGFSGDGGLATAAKLDTPYGVAVDAAGNLFIAGWGSHRIRKVEAANGIIRTVAGNGSWGFSGDGGPATAAGLLNPSGVAVDASGNLFIADPLSNRVRMVTAASGIITTVAGNGSFGFGGDGGPATEARLYDPYSVAVDATGNLYIADQRNHRVRKVTTSDRRISTVAGNGTQGFSGDGGAATKARLSRPWAVAVDAGGNLLIADSWNNRIRKVSAGSEVISTVAGSGNEGYIGDGGPATAAKLSSPGIAIDTTGHLFVADWANRRIRKVDIGSGTISTVAGSGNPFLLGDGGPATAAGFDAPSGIAVDTAGNLFIADFSDHRIRKVDAVSNIISTVAGNGEGIFGSFGGDGGPATAAGLSRPRAVVADLAGNLFIADTWNNRIRKVDAASGIISTIAGDGRKDFGGDGGPATAGRLDWPSGIAVDAAGNLFVADTGNHRIRKVAAASGIISTVLGNGSPFTLNAPESVAVDAVGNLFIADTDNHRIKKVAASSGIVSTVAGSGRQGFVGDGGPATAASLSGPAGLAVDAAANVWIADTGGDRIRAVYACATVSTPTLTSPAHGSSGIATTPQLSWEEVGGAFRYDVYLDESNPPERIAASEIETPSFAPTNLKPLTTYHWMVVAKGDPFCVPLLSRYSEVRSFTTASGCEAPGESP